MVPPGCADLSHRSSSPEPKGNYAKRRFVSLRLQHTLEASDFIRRRMPLIKLLTALVLALALVYAWTV